MPVKNTSCFLTECLDSILQQTFVNWELIAVDDNSTDNSYNILTSYSNKDNRILVLKNNSPGIIPALQLAYSNCKGDFITRMDSDDTMEPQKLELLYKSLLNKGSGYIAVGLVNYFSNSKLGDGYTKYANWLNKLTLSESNFKDIYKECTIPSPCWMLSKSDFEKAGGFNSSMYPEDYDLAFRIKKQNIKVTAVKKTIHNWRDYSTRTSRTDYNYSDNRFSELKIKHFLGQDYNSQNQLTLWGAGNKGKKLAKLLIENDINFNWICNNNNKIGKHIYDIEMQDLQPLNKKYKQQVIIAISTVNEIQQIKNITLLNKQHQYFWFC